VADPHVILCGGLRPTGLSRSWRNADRLTLAIGKGSCDVHFSINELSKSLSARIPDIAIDLAELAAYVYVADQAIRRGGTKEFEYGKKWHRRLRFEIPVRCPEVWNRPDIQNALQTALEFLTDDVKYEFGFRRAINPTRADQYLPDVVDSAGEIDEVMLFSGGLDSLCGAVEEVLVGQRRVALVSHRPVSTIDARQRKLVREIRKRRKKPALLPLHVPVTANKGKPLNQEFTQRSRSFLFASIAAVVAGVFKLSRIRFYENGVTSLNLPVSPSVLGGRASRTTHPQTLSRFGELFSLLFDTRFEVQNPFQWQTKAEILKRLRSADHADLCAQTSSCAHPWGRTEKQPHCGRCSQCVDRRLSVLAAGLENRQDPSGRYERDVLTGERTGADLTFAERYYGTAREMDTIDSPRAFATRYGEINLAISHTGLDSNQTVLAAYELCKRHALGIAEAAQKVIGAQRAEVFRQAYSPNSLLGVIVGRPPSPNDADTHISPPSANGESTGSFIIDPESLEVRFQGRECFLGNTNEMRLIERLYQSAGKYVSITVLGNDVWGDPEVEKNAIQRTVSNLRRKLCKKLSPAIVIDGSQKARYRLVIPSS